MDSLFFIFMVFFTILGMLVYNKIRSSPQTNTIVTSSSPNPKHHVFPSFYGPDVRSSFLSQLLHEFSVKGINPFIDNNYRLGDSIPPEVVEAIRRPRIAIVILSRNYASSSSSLNELVEIMKCREELGQTVMVVFYKVDQTDVKKQIGDFGKFFRKTCRGETKEDVERWSQALTEVAKIFGYNSLSWDDESAMIEKIVTDISNILKNSATASNDFKGLVGMEAHLEKMEPLLCLNLENLREIGIWGPPGIGKTTIARCLYQQYSNQFQLSVFMEKDLKMRYPRHVYDDYYNTRLQLQNQLFSQVVNQNDIEIPHLGVTQERWKDKKVLVVLDDVDNLVQLEALAKETWWFGPGSRIIIITQDQRLLKAHGINHIYKVDIPPPDEALQIFCMYAFGQKSPFNGFVKLAREVTTLSGKHPLGLRFMGSYFRGMTKEEWKNELPRLRTSLDRELLSIIKFTYDSLSGEDKELSHHHISSLGDDELTEKVEEYLAKQFSEVRQELIITNQDLKEDLNTSERDFKGISKGLQHSINIYCSDTLKHSFASYLSMDFHRKGFYAYVNCNEALDKIEGASASVLVFSNNCLTTSYLQNKTGQLVVPVFYGISPSDVVVQDYDYESADQIREWSSALQELRELPCYQLKAECNECELVEEIVKDVYEKLFPTEQIGINSRLLEIEHLLCKQPWDIRRIGIWGMPGIGKTTLAKEFYNQISGSYEASCFISDFDKAFQEKGLHHLLEEHFGEIMKELPLVCNSITRPSLPEEKLSNKITLVVLDDVHNALVAESFLRGVYWFGPGSLIIITSRDKQVFRHCQINHVYEVQSLNKNQALQLLSQCAFGKHKREENLLEQSMELIDYANGNPLALSFYGGELTGKTLSEMETTFMTLKLRTPYKIHDLFESSYKTLDDIEKNIFLDIACFLNGENVEYVMQLLEGCGFFPHVGIDILVEKCMVTVSENRVRMHRIIQDVGREIINRETLQTGRRHRLWEPWTIKILLEDDKLKEKEEASSTHILGTEDIEGIFLDATSLLFDVKPTAFDEMINLRFLKIYYSNYPHGIRLPKGLESLPYELRLLHWQSYPLQSLPQDFDPCYLVELNMPNSQLQKLWARPKNLNELKTLRLYHSQELTEVDDICNAPNVEVVDLQGCSKLKSFPATGQLQHLRVIDLSGCKEISSFPEVSPNIEKLYLKGTAIKELPVSIGNATNLEILDVSDCSSLVELPASFGNAINLRKLYFNGCSGLVELPESTGNAIDLEILDLSNCSSLVELPSSFENFINLKELNLTGCSSIVKLPLSFRSANNLKKLHLAGCSSLLQLHASFGNATNLEILDLSDCSSLVELPSSFGNFINLKELYLTGCSSLVELPASIGNTPNLEILDLSNCSSLLKLPSSFGNFKNLKELYLSECSSLVELPVSFGNTVNLKKLNLTGCSKIVELPNSFENAINLEKLYFRGCSSLAKLPDSFGNAINIKELDVGGCSCLVQLPSSFGNAVNLEILNLSDCSNLLKLPATFENFKKLKELYLTGCSSLVELPSSFGNVISLEKIYFRGCSSLVELPDSFGNAINTKELDLGGCSRLVEVPSSFGNAASLEILNFSNCSNLVVLPASFGSFKNIKELYLSGCSSLVELPEAFGNAINLEKLYFRGCSSLVDLPALIGNSINLKKLYLDGCSSLVELPESFGNAVNLEILYLRGCSSLTELPASFRKATNLEILDLTDCSSLVELPHSFGNLKKLYLRGCSSLIELPALFGNATNLELLDLSGCSSLVKLPDSFGNLKNLYLRGCSSLVELSAFGNATNLELLDLSDCSSLAKLPDSVGNLKKLYLRGCSRLTEISAFLGNATNLELLDLSDCSRLEKLPGSFGNLKKLYLRRCSSLIELPATFGNTTNLELLDLSGCSSLMNLPDLFGNLKKLYLRGCSKLTELPASFGNATNLELLNLSDCSSLVKLPDSFGNAINLKRLYLRGCLSLIGLPDSFGNATKLKTLDLSGCSSLVKLPPSIGNATNLKKLDLRNCSSLVEIPSSIGNAINLQEFYLENCPRLVLPSSFENDTNLGELRLTEILRPVEFSPPNRNSTSLMSELDEQRRIYLSSR